MVFRERFVILHCILKWQNYSFSLGITFDSCKLGCSIGDNAAYFLGDDVLVETHLDLDIAECLQFPSQLSFM